MNFKVSTVATPVNWNFDELLDPDAMKEIREFYMAIDKSQGCATILPVHTPKRD